MKEGGREGDRGREVERGREEERERERERERGITILSLKSPRPFTVAMSIQGQASIVPYIHCVVRCIL